MVGSITGIIVTGILINVIWEMLKSSSGIFIVFLVKITTLGIQSLNDSIYKEIARGLHEDISLQIYTLLMTIFISFIIALLWSFFLLKKKIRNYEKEEYKHKKIIKNFITGKKGSFVLIAYAVFYLTFFTFDIARNVYINRLIAYYNQLVLIIGPQIDPQFNKIIDSRFSQIQNSSDYISLINELEILIKNNNLKMPKKPSLI